jgi:hypothetical protein
MLLPPQEGPQFVEEITRLVIDTVEAGAVIVTEPCAALTVSTK